jgi:hypothetical protein
MQCTPERLARRNLRFPEEDIKHLESVLTIVGGKVVYAIDEFSKLAPPALPVSPGWSPVNEYGGYAKARNQTLGASHSAACSQRPPTLQLQSSITQDALRR